MLRVNVEKLGESMCWGEGRLCGCGSSSHGSEVAADGIWAAETFCGVALRMGGQSRYLGCWKGCICELSAPTWIRTASGEKSLRRDKLERGGPRQSEEHE
mmetsp:Transcript_1744/g.5287  ORF Transcript_1744/g.5287 Transcript_1744/m.5287 type:complete len:100 (-) Transcript_1744:1432-1731(-)